MGYLKFLWKWRRNGNINPMIHKISGTMFEYPSCFIKIVAINFLPVSSKKKICNFFFLLIFLQDC